MLTLETQNLSYSFGDGERVLHEVSLQVPAQSIYGFLGPNGAGKTTTMRLMLGLLRLQNGTIRVFGEDFQKHRIKILKQTGSLIESPSFYSHLTARENLRVFQKVHQCPLNRIDYALELVGLSHTGKKTVGKFSLGMKQRLGIAIAMLHDPQLLVLDEPTNGLDPNGMIEVRELLLRVNRQHGVTVFISSHLLAEIEKLVTHMGVINRGKMVFQGTIAALREQQASTVTVFFSTNSTEASVRLLTEMGLEVTVHDGRVHVRNISSVIVAGINRNLVKEGIEVYEIGHVRNDLESIFMELIS